MSEHVCVRMCTDVNNTNNTQSTSFYYTGLKQHVYQNVWKPVGVWEPGTRVTLVRVSDAVWKNNCEFLSEIIQPPQKAFIAKC